MTGSSWTWTLDRKICSDTHLGAQLIAEVLLHLQENHWGDKDIFGVHMAMEEAVMNAIKHGNQRDDKKCVKVNVKTTRELFWARVEDEGPGFDPECVPDPTLDENIEKSCGRGVMLMRHYMDEVTYNPVGNIVELKKQRTGK